QPGAGHRGRPGRRPDAAQPAPAGTARLKEPGVQSMNGSPRATAVRLGAPPRPDAPPAGDDVKGGSARRPPWLLTGSAALVCAALLMPVTFLIWQATGVGWPVISRLLVR